MATSLLDRAKEFSRDLDTLDKDITVLKREYDLFFAGVSQKQPFELRRKVEGIIKKHRASQIQKYELMFRYQTLVSKFNSYCDFWEKIFKRRELDPKAITPYGPLPSQVTAQNASNGNSNGRDNNKPEAASQAPNNSDPDSKIRRIYDEYVSAKKATGESVDNLKFDNFRRLLTQQVAKIKEQKQCTDIDFTVSIKEGKVNLKAKPIK